MKITVCIGSSCHIKGSRQVVQQLESLIEAHGLADEIELGGRFCMGNCQKGVSVSLQEHVFSLTPETVEAFFAETVLPRLQKD